jgi:hypothetical protein
VNKNPFFLAVQHCHHFEQQAPAVCVVLLYVFCCAFAVLLHLLFVVLSCVGWHVLHHAAAGPAVHACQKYIIFGLQLGAGWSCWHPFCCCDCCVHSACQMRQIQDMFRLLVLAYSVGCWVVLGGVVSLDQQGSCSTHAWQCCTAWQPSSAAVVVAFCYRIHWKQASLPRLLSPTLTRP